MTRNKTRIAAILLLVFLGGTFCASGICFTTNPTFTDAFNDHTDKDFASEDIWYVWIAHTDTQLMFKVELNGSWDISYSALYIWISVDDTTGSNVSGYVDFLADYMLRLVWSPILGFCDLNDGTADIYTAGPKDVPDAVTSGLGGYSFSSDNRTVTIWYNLQSSVGGKGYLDVAVGQTIKVKFQAFTDSDYAPNYGLAPLTYTLNPDLTWVIVLSIVLPIVGVALGLFWYYRWRA